MARWLYRYEAKGIQGYVLASSRLREIAGASELVDRLADDTEQWCRALGLDAETYLKVNAAGGATLEIPDDATLAAFAGAWPLYCARTRPGLQIAQAWVQIPEGTLDPERYRECLRALIEKLGEDRMRPAVALPEPGPLVERATRTGLGAVRDDRVHGLLDEATHRKLAAVDRARRASLMERLLGEGPLAGARFADDNLALGEGYVAVVHADGNGIGRLVQETPFERLAAFSHRLRDATEAATRLALERALERRGNAALPVRVVVLGGDDVTVITHGADALPFARAFLAAFRDETRDRLRDFLPDDLRDGLAACAGVALVKDSFPYHAAYDLAEQLTAAAKAHVRVRGGGSALAFHRVTTASVRSWDEIRDDELAAKVTRPGEETETWRLDGGPWTLAAGERGLDALARLVAYLGPYAVPKGSVREWLRVAHSDRARADAVWKRMTDVLRQDLTGDGEMTYEAFRETLARLGTDPDTGWRADRTTPVADALSWLAVDPRAWRNAPTTEGTR